MGLLKRLFSGDYRAAVAAEAVGDLDTAAQRFARAGEFDRAATLHLARSQRCSDPRGRIEALRQARHWAREGTPVSAEVARALGSALLEQLRGQGVHGEADREGVREAVALLTAGGAHEEAAKALEEIGDYDEAVQALALAGRVERLEEVAAIGEAQQRTRRAITAGYADYEAFLRSGQRSRARDALLRCVEQAQDRSTYLERLRDLESRRIGRRIHIERAEGPHLVGVGGGEWILGRDVGCDIILGGWDVSRRHARLFWRDDAAWVEDLGSRSGVSVAGIRISGAVPLAIAGDLKIAHSTSLRYQGYRERVLRLEVIDGVGVGEVYWAVCEGATADLSADQLALGLRFEGGRFTLHPTDGTLRLNGEELAVESVEALREDRLTCQGVELVIG